MSEMRVSSPARDLLLQLAAGDERALRAILRPTIDRASGEESTAGELLDRRTRSLVALGALLTLDAPTDSVRWAVDLASTAGAGEETLAAVLLATGSTAGAAQLVSSAARLAAALDYDTGAPEEPAPAY
ncbi:MAG: carboxymuconolactone decarboxylase family protein [Solirubrobacterales bacterium]|nr:carboxymuconolactone decarboxylase family protein [Solirubrobacterales bacterium]